MEGKSFQKAYGKLVTKAWSDDDFKSKLLADPMAVFKENELIIPEGIEVRMVENTKDTIHYILPTEPSDYFGALCGQCICCFCDVDCFTGHSAPTKKRFKNKL